MEELKWSSWHLRARALFNGRGFADKPPTASAADTMFRFRSSSKYFCWTLHISVYIGTCRQFIEELGHLSWVTPYSMKQGSTAISCGEDVICEQSDSTDLFHQRWCKLQLSQLSPSQCMERKRSSTQNVLNQLRSRSCRHSPHYKLGSGNQNPPTSV